jgi:hypothetical protein
MDSGRFWLVTKRVERAIIDLEPYIKSILYGFFVAYGVLALAMGATFLLAPSKLLTVDEIKALQYALEKFTGAYFLVFIVGAVILGRMRGWAWVGRLRQHGYMRAALFGFLVWVPLYFVGLYILARNQEVLPSVASASHIPVWIVEAWPYWLAIICVTKALFNEAYYDGHRWALFLPALWVGVVPIILPLGLLYALLPPDKAGTLYPDLCAVALTVPLWLVARRDAETVDEWDLLWWLAYALMGSSSMVWIGRDLLHVAFPDVTLGRNAEFIVGAIGTLLGLRVCWRMMDQISTLRAWFSVSLVAGALVSLIYTYHLGHFPGFESLASSAAHGGVYAFAATLFVMLWRYQPAGGTRSVKQTVLGIDRSVERATRVVVVTDTIAFHIVIGGCAAFIFYFLWNWNPPPIPTGRPDNPNQAIFLVLWIFWPVRLAIYGLLAACVALAVKGLWIDLISLLEKSPLEDEKAHGKAGKATEATAIEAARGGPGKPPWADHRYKD